MLLMAHLTPFCKVWPGCCHFGRGCSSKQGRTDISLRISWCVLKGWQL
jgi:hypothetical protein